MLKEAIYRLGQYARGDRASSRVFRIYVLRHIAPYSCDISAHAEYLNTKLHIFS